MGAELPEDFVREFAELYTAPLRLFVNLTGYEAWCVMSALQLALSHPGYPERLRLPVESFARELQAGCALTPALKRVAERGWERG